MAFVHESSFHFEQANNCKALYTPLEDELAQFKSVVLDKSQRYEQMYLFNEKTFSAPGGWVA